MRSFAAILRCICNCPNTCGYMFMVVSKPYWLLLKVCEQDMNITCSNWLLLKVPEQAYEHHHCKSYWWLLKLPECVVSTFVLATLEQLLWDFFWQPFFSWGHTWTTSLKRFLITFFFRLFRAHLKDVFETWGTSLKFFITLFEGTSTWEISEGLPYD